MKIVAIIAARMASSRLPGKVLLPAAGYPLLGHMIQRLKHCRRLDEIVVATTALSPNLAITEVAHEYGATGFSWLGSEQNVLGRFVGASYALRPDVIVELFSDCPLIDPRIVDDAVLVFESGEYDIVTNGVQRSYPDGMDLVVYSTKTLRRTLGLVYAQFASAYDREHISTYMRRHPDKFVPFHLRPTPSLEWPELGLTLDEERDYELIRRIIEHFHP